MNDRLEKMIEAGRKASEIISTIYRRTFKITYKEDKSPVTEADLASDALIQETLSGFEDCYYLSEEKKDDLRRLSYEKVFIVDPLDGTQDFVNHDGSFSVNIAYCEKGLPMIGVIALPLEDVIVYAVKGEGSYIIRKDGSQEKIHVSDRTDHLIMMMSMTHIMPAEEELIQRHKDRIAEVRKGGASSKAVAVAMGEADCSVRYTDMTKEWDVCAPDIIVREAGGIFADTNLNAFTYNKKDVYNHNGYAMLNRIENKFYWSEVMKKKTLSLVLTLAVLPFLAGCGGLSSASSSEETSYSSATDTGEVNSSSETSDSSESNTSDEDSSSVYEGEVPSSFTIFSINDTHGAYEQYDYNSEPGIEKLYTAITSDSDYDESSSIIVANGDNYQGSYICYENGYLADECLSAIGVVATSVGNHEFDRGIDYLADLSANADFPYLACNIFDSHGNYASFCQPSTIVEKSGVKIGLIGAIGADLESSISTSSLEGYTFSSDQTLIQNEIDYLNERDCDIITILLHEASDESYTAQVANTLNSNGLHSIFGGHSHDFVKTTVDSVYYVQGGSNSKGYSKIKYSTKTGGVLSSSYVNISGNYKNIEVDRSDEVIMELESLIQAVYDSGTYDDSVITCLDSEFRRYYETRSLVPQAMIYAARQEGLTGNIVAIHNSAGIRAGLPAGNITMSNVFRVSPFDNLIKVLKNVSGTDAEQVARSYVWGCEKEDGTYSSSSIDTSLTYSIVVIDYVSEGNYFRLDGTQYDLGNNCTEEYFVRQSLVDYLSSKDMWYASDFSDYN